jgi:hypothetical protein
VLAGEVYFLDRMPIHFDDSIHPNVLITITGVLTAVLWIRPFPMPHHVCATPEEGLEWLKSLARRAA